jgi:Sulfotransferase domain
VLLNNERLRRLGGGLPAPVKHRAKDTLFRTFLRSTDVFLVGHPKSGNTWLAYLLAILQQEGDADRRVTVANLGRFVPTIHGRDLDILEHRNLSEPRVFRNEFPNFPERYPKTLYVVRDPRSVLVSYYHHYKIVTGDQDTVLDEFVDRYLTDGCILTWETLERWDVQVREWLQRSRDSNVIIVTYEEMHRDRRHALQRVATFCGLTPSKEALDVTVERGGFEAMRSEEQREGAEAYLDQGGETYREKRVQRSFYRKGRINSWKTELSRDSRSAIEREFGPEMKTLGYLPEPMTDQREIDLTSLENLLANRRGPADSQSG